MKKSIVIFMHIGYWLLYFLLIVIILIPLWIDQSNSQQVIFEEFPQFLIQSPFGVTAIFPAIISFYIFYFLLFKKFLLRKKIVLFFIVGIVSCFISSIAGVAALSIFFGRNMIFGDGYQSASSIVIVLGILAGIHGIIAIVIRGFIEWFGDIKLKEELNRKNQEMEIGMIKSQLNPHFLFNTIQNIDVLISKDPNKASRYLNKLSDIMRFMLYETKTDFIPLQMEVTYIEKFIDLQRIRSSNENYIQFRVNGKSEKKFIAPMLFIPFIENAFKYADNRKADDAIKIIIEIYEMQILFVCENVFKKEFINKEEAGGLGIDLIKKRLQLLYPNMHTLEISDFDDIYKVQLNVNLNGNELHRN